MLAKLRATWFGIETLPLRTVTPSDVSRWLARHYGEKSASYYNAALSVIRTALEMAVKDRIIAENPAKDLKYRKRNETDSADADLRAVQGDRGRHSSAEVQPRGGAERRLCRVLRAGRTRAGRGCAITRGDVDLEAGRIIVYRRKTDTGFVIPIYPQLRPLVEKLCNGKGHERSILHDQRSAEGAGERVQAA